MTKESIPSRIRKYIDLKLENKETQESISNTNNKISNFKPKILRKLGYDQGLCWGSPSRMPEDPKVAENRRLPFRPKVRRCVRRLSEEAEGL